MHRDIAHVCMPVLPASFGGRGKEPLAAGILQDELHVWSVIVRQSINPQYQLEADGIASIQKIRTCSMRRVYAGRRKTFWI